MGVEPVAGRTSIVSVVSAGVVPLKASVLHCCNADGVIGAETMLPDDAWPLPVPVCMLISSHQAFAEVGE